MWLSGWSVFDEPIGVSGDCIVVLYVVDADLAEVHRVVLWSDSTDSQSHTLSRWSVFTSVTRDAVTLPLTVWTMLLHSAGQV